MIRPVIILAFMLPGSALAGHHGDMPGHWYDGACCSQHDCYPLPDGSVEAGPEGWVLPTGDVVEYGSSKERDSQDGHFHECRPKMSQRLRCLYVPGAGT